MVISREASSASSASGHRYQVFLSFRGKDTRKGFTDHLYTGLLSAGIHTFLDEIELERGRGISRELRKAIEESKIAIIVFSKNYAESEWCLEELVRILEMKKTRGLIVIPVFYDVQPSELKSQRGCFGQAFSMLEKRKLESEEMMNKMEKWRAALNEVADLAGMVLRNEADGDSSPSFVFTVTTAIGLGVFTVKHFELRLWGQERTRNFRCLGGLLLAVRFDEGHEITSKLQYLNKNHTKSLPSSLIQRW